MHAYDEIYLDDAMKNLGEALDYSANVCHIDADEFMELFIAGGFAYSFGSGSPKSLSGLSGTELVMETLTKAGLDITLPKPQAEYDCSPEYWCGWILAYYQWKTGRSFRNIHDRISMAEILRLYPILHEASEDRAADTVSSIIARKNTVSGLQYQRRICGYSQKELAERSGVNLRTLQQYEQKTKEIDRASVQTVKALADVLGCRMEDILEYTPKDGNERQ